MESNSFYISANGMAFSYNPPIFRSDSNSATLRFTSDFSFSEAGILMLYVLSKCLNLKFLNANPFMDVTYYL